MMLYEFTATLVLLSALSNYYASAAIVSLVVPGGVTTLPYTGNFLGTDSEGHTSWSIGLPPSFTSTAAAEQVELADGTLVVGPTDVQQVAATTFTTEGRLVSETLAAGCALATAIKDGAVPSGHCSAYAQAGFTRASGAEMVAATTTAFPLPVVAVQIPDSGPGAVPTGVTVARPASTGNSAAKGRLAGTVSGWGVAGVAGLLLAGFL